MNTNLVGAGPHIILCGDAFSKCSYLATLASDPQRPIIYLDVDLLYSGYTQAGMLDALPHILVRRPDPSDWDRELVSIIRMTSASPHLIIVDTLNGLGGMWNRHGGMRLAVNSIMLMASLGRSVGTTVVVAAVSRQGKTGWEMVPGGRLIPGAGRLYTLSDGRAIPLADRAQTVL